MTAFAYEQTDAQQRLMWDTLRDSPRGGTAQRPEGYLTGPFNVLLRSPALGTQLANLGTILRYDCSLTDRQRELVILIVCARTHAAFPYLRHVHYARAAGIPEPVIEAIGAGRRPAFDRDDDAALAAFADELLATHTIGDGTYRSMVASVGERVLVELVALVGYYMLEAFILNAFDVPAPAGEAAPWASPLGRD